jgi:hypothetical protein
MSVSFFAISPAPDFHVQTQPQRYNPNKYFIRARASDKALTTFCDEIKRTKREATSSFNSPAGIRILSFSTPNKTCKTSGIMGT